MIFIEGKDTGFQFDIYLERQPNKTIVAVHDPQTEYYLKSIIENKVVRKKNIPNHLIEITPTNLEDRYRSDFIKFVKSNPAYFYKIHRSTPADYANQIPGLINSVKHPLNGRNYTIHDTIISLNDEYKWTREQIADWLETLDENPIIEPPKEE